MSRSVERRLRIQDQFSAASIRTFRAGLEMSKAEFARQLELGSAGACSVWRWETGLQRPSVESQRRLRALAKARKVSL